ncbi:MAG: zinc carboxypeptidase [Bacteroidetes bacterium]|nr:zinc carboxypeptidase [Bacteroidota bacterium]
MYSNIHSAPDGNAVTLDYYLPQDVTFNPDVPKPSDVLGFEVGFRHARASQITAYMYALAAASDRIHVEQYATSHGHRPVMLMVASSPENMSNLDELRQQHLQLSNPSVSASLDISEMPLVVWQGFSVHGNEPSAANSAILLMYYLAAAEGSEIDRILNETIVIIDPVINPDGHDRFAHWANMHVGRNMVGDPNHREHLEVWPGGRTNHYWFDLNRDWMPVQHPESRGRIVQFHNWKPNILNDYHEMGTNSPYFFQPGVPSRNNPLTPERTFELTQLIAEYHAEALDQFGSLYWTREVFDDFYVGKGSTYPDINGSIGILYEQGSSRGHVQESIYGKLTFPFTIRNQFITTLSTMRAGVDLRMELLSHQRDFFRTALSEASRSEVKAYVFAEPEDPARVWHLLDLLGHHQIDVFELNRNITVDGVDFVAGDAFVVPVEQKQYRFLTSLFETRTEFTDSLFYDVSTWTLPLSFNLKNGEIRGRAWSQNLMGQQVERSPAFPKGEIVRSVVNHEQSAVSNVYAYAFSWSGYYAPRAVNRLLREGIVVQTASRTFDAVTGEGLKTFDFGTIVVPMGIQQPDTFSKVHELMEAIAAEDAVTVYELSTGLSRDGIDLGSRNFNLLRKPEVMILGGAGVTPNDVGEVWHLLDQRYDMELSIVEIPRFNAISLDRYNTIILVNGNYNGVSSGSVEKLRRWVADGGTLILHRGAVGWASRNGLANVQFRGSSDDEDSSTDQSGMVRYIDETGSRGAQVIGGSIFRVNIDTTHPLLYGFNRSQMPVFRNTATMVEPPSNPFAMPMQYDLNNPLFSGYISDENMERIKGTAGIVVGGIGSGRVIMKTDNPTFRAFWFGTNKLLANSIFFGHTISGQTTQRSE